jgi:hypothetical protein
MIGAGEPLERQDFPRKRTQAALHAVAHHGAADLFGDGKADADERIGILSVADEQDEAGSARAKPGVRGEKVRAFPERD